jgi:hypothetical protein
VAIRVTKTDLYVINTRTRMPFRFGIGSLSALPHIFVRVAVEVDGRRAVGVSADGLPPKWFKKDPDQSYRDELAEMLHVIESACQFAQDLPAARTVFDFWQSLYTTQMQWATREGYPPLLWNFGVSLVERAMIDAYCRATGVTFADALRRNTLGIVLGEMHAELVDAAPGDLLPPAASRSMLVRTTVGLGDPIHDDNVPAGQRLDDGLPESLEAAMRTCGIKRFKFKARGDVQVDAPRLKRLHTLLEQHTGDDYAFTLDLNELFTDAAAFKAYWQAMRGDDDLDAFFEHLIVIEQPLRRDLSTTADVHDVLRSWDDRPPIIIDESDCMLASLPDALDCGYVGTAFKSCKGVIKGVSNACLLEHRRRSDGGRYVLTCEDLGIIGPVALGQDLAVAASLGVEHCERMGMHYFRGISHLPRDMQRQALEHHGDLYMEHNRGFVAPRAASGRLQLGTTVDAPFGLGYEFDPTPFTPLDDWNFESLGLME